MSCKIGYLAYRVPSYHIYDILDDIFRISKIHSRQLIIFYFSVFCQKKKIVKSAKNYLHYKYRLFVILIVPKKLSVYLIRRLRYLTKSDIGKKN